MVESFAQIIFKLTSSVEPSQDPGTKEVAIYLRSILYQTYGEVILLPETDKVK